MSCCLGRTLNSHFKYYLTNQAYGQKFYSVLYPLSYKTLGYNGENNKRVIVWDPKHIQYRHLSSEGFQKFYSDFYESVTSSAASKLLKEGLVGLHDVSGLPWWCTIIVATAGLRLFFGFPIGVYQQYLMAKLALIKIELKRVAKKVKDDVIMEGKRGLWTKEKAILKFNHEMRKHTRDLYVKNNCHPFKIVILTWAQLPVWVVMSLTLRKFAADATTNSTDSIPAALQFKVGGALWFQDLTLPDPALILPLILSLVTIFSIQLNVWSGNHPVKLFSKILVNGFRFFAILSFFISALVPSGVCLYWTSTAIFALAQSFLFLSPKMRRLFRIPKAPKELEKPYSHVWAQMIESFKRISTLGGRLQKK